MAESPSNDHAPGRMLQLTAAPDQPLSVDSPVFAVTPGAEFAFSATASSPEASKGTGFIAVVFLDGEEVERAILPFEPVSTPLAKPWAILRVVFAPSSAALKRVDTGFACPFGATWSIGPCIRSRTWSWVSRL